MNKINLVLVVVVVCLAGAKVFCSEQDDWRPIYRRVFAEGGERPAGPAETLGLLEELERIYSRENEPAFGASLARVHALIEVSHINLEKCRLGNLVEGMVSRYYAQYKVNLIPYMRHYGKLQEKACKEAGIRPRSDGAREPRFPRVWQL